MVNFLFTSIGRRVQLIKYFCRWAEGQGKAKIVSADISPLAPAADFSHKHYAVPRINDPHYIPSLLEICRKEQVGALIPLLEPEFPVLAAQRREFESIGTTLVLSPDKALEICQDKYKTYQFFCSAGIASPATYLPEELQANTDLKESSFPLFIKPRSGMGSASTYKVSTKRELDFFLEYVPSPLVQEFIEGIEYTMDVINDLAGKPIAVVPRERLEVRAGEVSKSRTVTDQKLIDLTVEVAEKLGGVGPLTIQAFEKADGKRVFTEINPRFGGGVPLAIEAGVNYPELLAKMIKGEAIDNQIGKYRSGLYMLRYDEALYTTQDILGGPVCEQSSSIRP